VHWSLLGLFLCIELRYAWFCCTPKWAVKCAAPMNGRPWMGGAQSMHILLTATLPCRKRSVWSSSKSMLRGATCCDSCTSVGAGYLRGRQWTWSCSRSCQHCCTCTPRCVWVRVLKVHSCVLVQSPAMIWEKDGVKDGVWEASCSHYMYIHGRKILQL
jgi:hypothetical protein